MTISWPVALTGSRHLPKTGSRYRPDCSVADLFCLDAEWNHKL